MPEEYQGFRIGDTVKSRANTDNPDVYWFVTGIGVDRNSNSTGVYLAAKRVSDPLYHIDCGLYNYISYLYHWNPDGSTPDKRNTIKFNPSSFKRRKTDVSNR